MDDDKTDRRSYAGVMAFPTHRPRRLRATPALRRLVAETTLRPRQLVLPMFVKEGAAEPTPIASMPGVVQHTRDSLLKAAVDAVTAGVGGLMLFGVPARRDATGTAGVDPDGVLNVALRDVRSEVGDATVIMADTCLDEFTDHGHCGVLGDDGGVDNDATLAVYARDGRGAGRRGGAPAGPERDDGRPGRRDPGCARRRGPPGHGDPRLHRQVRLGVLRAVPRGGGAASCAATARPTSRTPGTSASRCASSPSTSRRAPTW